MAIFGNLTTNFAIFQIFGKLENLKIDLCYDSKLTIKMEIIHKYKDILEYIPQNIKKYDNIHLMYLYKIIKNFLIEQNINNLLISLSGGVDSMVLFEIIDDIKLNSLTELNIILCHINYNNRKESIDERDFLIEYCLFKNHDLKVLNLDFTRDELKRDVYEKESRCKRYNFYHTLNEEFNLQGVFLAHHQDDLVENIFNNLMRGSRELTDLTVLKDKNEILDVIIYRPMLSVRKDIIYNFAHQFNIPYFLDTTPDWSCRGKMRRNIFPKCIDCYTDKYKDNLLKIGKESDDLNIIINEYILKDLVDKTIVCDGNIKIKKEKIIQEKYILKNLLLKIAHKYNLVFKFKIIDNILSNYHKNIKLSMSKDYTVHISDDSISFIKT